jgi:hypothetical protein
MTTKPRHQVLHSQQINLSPVCVDCLEFAEILNDEHSCFLQSSCLIMLINFEKKTVPLLYYKKGFERIIAN